MVTFIGEISFGESPLQKARGMPKALRAALESSVKLWHKLMLPKHFVPLATRRYGYKPRKRGYMIRKAHMKRHQNPIVWTGRTRSMMTSRIFIGSTGRRGRAFSATGKMSVPPYIGIKSRKGKRPNYRRELTETTADEAIIIREHVKTQLFRNLTLKPKRRTRKVI